jgi:hypothetical protein
MSKKIPEYVATGVGSIPTIINKTEVLTYVSNIVWRYELYRRR